MSLTPCTPAVAPPARPPRADGFTLVEIAITLAVLALLATMAVPNYLGSRAASNEAAVVATLRSLVDAQSKFRLAAHVDRDDDGIGEYGTLGELAGQLGLDAKAVAVSVARWNALCAAGGDTDFGRPAGSMLPIIQPPYYGAPVYPVISNTQGGPVHDAQSRVIDVYGLSIPRLYAAGECGSSFGHLYLSGGNIAECVVTGRIAGRHVAQLKPLKS